MFSPFIDNNRASCKGHRWLKCHFLFAIMPGIGSPSNVAKVDQHTDFFCDAQAYLQNCMLSPSAFCHGWGRQACRVLLPSEAAPIPMLVSSTFCPLHAQPLFLLPCQDWGRQACRVLLPSEAAPRPILVSSTFCPLHAQSLLLFSWMGQAGMLGAAAF